MCLCGGGGEDRVSYLPSGAWGRHDRRDGPTRVCWSLASSLELCWGLASCLEYAQPGPYLLGPASEF